jgi:hypothetical protein
MVVMNRREFLAAGVGLVGAAATTGTLVGAVWPVLTREDLVPVEAPDVRLRPRLSPGSSVVLQRPANARVVCGAAASELSP